MFSGGKVEPTAYKLKNAGAATAVGVILADRDGRVIDLDVQ
jgi:hypothetical protein